MKKLSITFAMILFFALGANAQMYNPVKWSVASKKTANNEAVVFIKATIENGWHIYGMQVPKNGPVSTSFVFKKSDAFDLVGKAMEPKAKSKYEQTFNMTVPYHSTEVIFQQKIKLKKSQANVSGTVTFMACDKSQCLPPDEYNFTVTVK